MPQTLIAAFMLLMGGGIALVWTRDILVSAEFDRSDGLARARTPEGTLLLPHWIAEYATAAALIIGAVALIADAGWGVPLAAAALGATCYTSANSLGWALADRSRLAYAVPMTIGLVGGLACLTALVLLS